MHKFLIVLISLLISCWIPKKEVPLVCEKQINDDDLKINLVIDGSQTQLYPEVGKLQCGDKTCTATLIRDNVIITAEHCTDNCFNEYTQVIFRQFEAYKIDRFITHDELDVALGVLKESTAIKPRELSSTPPKNDDAVLVFGFGRFTPTSEASIKLNHGCVSVGDIFESEIHYYNDENQVSLCFGDSGGPTYLNKKIVGIHSHMFGVGDKVCRWGVFVDVRADIVIEWVNQVLND